MLWSEMTWCVLPSWTRLLMLFLIPTCLSSSMRLLVIRRLQPVQEDGRWLEGGVCKGDALFVGSDSPFFPSSHSMVSSPMISSLGLSPLSSLCSFSKNLLYVLILSPQYYIGLDNIGCRSLLPTHTQALAVFWSLIIATFIIQRQHECSLKTKQVCY